VCRIERGNCNGKKGFFGRHIGKAENRPSVILPAYTNRQDQADLRM
jgi:hypothetical protein